MPGQVFISHSSADRSWVEWIGRCAEHMGVVPYPSAPGSGRRTNPWSRNFAGSLTRWSTTARR
jgi:hypothetical protein